MQTCENCQFCGVLKVGRCDYPQCRRHAPKVITEGELAGSKTWPDAKLTDWCGEWKPKTKTNNPTVDAQCAFCGESKPFPAALVPIQPKPRVCAECAEKETTDAD